MLTVQCPKCEELLNLREEHLGVKGRCLHCRVPIIAERCPEFDEVVVNVIDPPSSPIVDKADQHEEAARSEPAKVEAQAPDDDAPLWPGEAKPEVALPSMGASLSGSFSKASSPSLEDKPADSSDDRNWSTPVASDPEHEITESHEEELASSERKEPEPPLFPPAVQEEAEPTVVEAKQDSAGEDFHAAFPQSGDAAVFESDTGTGPDMDIERGIGSGTEDDQNASEVSTHPPTAAWAAIIQRPAPLPEGATSPPLFKDVPLISEDFSSENQGDDSPPPNEEDLPRAASMVIEEPSAPKESAPKSDEQAQDHEAEPVAPSLFEKEVANSEGDAEAGFGIADSWDEAEGETLSWLKEPQTQGTEAGQEPPPLLEEEGKKSEPDAEAMPDVADGSDDAEGEVPWWQKAAETQGNEAGQEPPPLLEEEGEKFEADAEAMPDVAKISDDVESETLSWPKGPETEPEAEPEVAAFSKGAEAAEDRSEFVPPSWLSESEPELEPELEPEAELKSEPKSVAAEESEPEPKFGLEFEPLGSGSEIGTSSSDSEWTPFEFSSAEEIDKPGANMNPINPSDINPGSPLGGGASPEDNVESGNGGDATPSTEFASPSSSETDGNDGVDAGEDSQKQTVKKSALPPLVGMAGVAAFPVSFNDENENESTDEPSADSEVIDTNREEIREAALESTPPVLEDPMADSPPVFSDAPAGASDPMHDPAEDQNVEAEESSPVAEWAAAAAAAGSAGEESSASKDDTDSAAPVVADLDGLGDSGGEAKDAEGEDALARFAARIDGAALDKTSDSKEPKEESSDEDSGLLPWEKVEQQEKAKAESEAQESEDKVLKSEDGNVQINLDEEPKEKEDTFVNDEHKSAEMSDEEAAREKEYTSIIMGQANGDGAPVTNCQRKRKKRLKKKRRRRILAFLFLMFVGAIGALMYYKPGFRPNTFKAGVMTSWNEGKTQFDNGKLTDFSAIVDPLIELWTMGPNGTVKKGEGNTPGSTATAQTPAPAAPVANTPPAPAPAPAVATAQPDIVVAIPTDQKLKPVGARPVTLPPADDAAHAAAPQDPDSLTRAAPGENEEQRSARVAGEKILKGFYAARTAEEKLTFILNPNEVAGEIEEAYPSPVDTPTIRSMEFKGRLVDSGTQRAFGVFDVRENENGDRHRWCIPEVRSGEFKIDWGLYRQLANDELTRFLADPDAKPTELRLLLRRGDEVAAEDSPWNEPSLEMAVLMPLDDGSPSKVFMKRSTHDELGLNRDLGDGMARVGNFELKWVADAADGDTDGQPTATIVAIKNWGAWPSDSAGEAEKQTSVTPPEPADEVDQTVED